MTMHDVRLRSTRHSKLHSNCLLFLSLSLYLSSFYFYSCCCLNAIFLLFHISVHISSWRRRAFVSSVPQSFGARPEARNLSASSFRCFWLCFVCAILFIFWSFFAACTVYVVKEEYIVLLVDRLFKLEYQILPLLIDLSLLKVKIGLSSYI